jgi:hypothetical protein
MDILNSLIPPGGLSWFLVHGLAALAALAALLRMLLTGERAKEHNKHLEARARELEERLEMHREATDQERRARDLTDEEARKEAAQWSKP